MSQQQTQAVQAAQPQNQQVQKQQTPNQIAKAFTDQMMQSWGPAVKDIIPVERFARVVLSAINGNPKLQNALMTASGKTSLMKATMQSAQTGLLPDGYEAHLVPFNSKNGVEIQFIPDYKGLVKLARNSGDISTIVAETVCENDKFSWKNGEISHEIDWFNPRGEVKLYYVLVKMKDGSVQSKVMNKADVEKIRARSKSKDNGPWATDYDSMALKSCFKQISKWLPRSNERLANAVQIDNENDFPQLVDVTPKSRFDAPANAPQGGLLAALGGQPQPVEQPAEVANVPQEQPVEQPASQPEVQPQVAPVDKVKAETAIKLHLKNTQAPVNFAELKAWYELEFGEWNVDDALANIDSYVGKAFDWKANQ